jgi:glutathione synthase/RimK-type ligase-like ATP-grasp enzyme
MQANASKPLQAQLIGAAGFLVPETLVTSDPAEAQAFWREHTRVVFKSTSGVRSIVQELDQRLAARLPLLAQLPVQFQAYVPGTDVRVHVVGQRTFAVTIDSPVTDYRYAARDGAEAALAPTELPDRVAELCVALARQMELPLAGIDLRRRPDGQYVCFEVNPMPAYTYFEAQTGMPIGPALADLLMEARDGAGDRKSQRDLGNHRVAAAAPQD